LGEASRLAAGFLASLTRDISIWLDSWLIYQAEFSMHRHVIELG
jgi:hypothetical protein